MRWQAAFSSPTSNLPVAGGSKIAVSKRSAGWADHAEIIVL
jgi:hypothetical protein